MIELLGMWSVCVQQCDDYALSQLYKINDNHAYTVCVYQCIDMCKLHY